jgi:uncharacterized damage-inducible protein DinB
MSQIALLLASFDQAFDKKSWHGTNLRGSIRGLTAAKAAWRPDPRRHNIWEQVLHCAYWKYVVWRKLTGAERRSFPLEGSDWFVRPTEKSEAAWKQDVDLLARIHRQLRGAIAAFDPARLPKRPAGSKVSFQMLITGIIAHDLYHTGQIQLLKKLCQQAPDRCGQ